MFGKTRASYYSVQLAFRFEDSRLMGYDAASFDDWFPTFRTKRKASPTQQRFVVKVAQTGKTQIWYTARIFQ
jgi:hypothetical protein